MSLVTIKEYAEMHGKSVQTVRHHCMNGHFITAEKKGKTWLIDSEEPYPKTKTGIMNEKDKEMEEERRREYEERKPVLEYMLLVLSFENLDKKYQFELYEGNCTNYNYVYDNKDKKINKEDIKYPRLNIMQVKYYPYTGMPSYHNRTREFIPALKVLNRLKDEDIFETADDRVIVKDTEGIEALKTLIHDGVNEAIQEVLDEAISENPEMKYRMYDSSYYWNLKTEEIELY